MKQVRIRQSKEFKIKAVELSYEHGSVHAVSKELGINPDASIVAQSNERREADP